MSTGTDDAGVGLLQHVGVAAQETDAAGVALRDHRAPAHVTVRPSTKLAAAGGVDEDHGRIRR